MKKVAIILGVPVVLIAVAILCLVLFVNPNQFKPLITEQVEAQAGVQLHIDGDISWKFFPSFGLKVESLRIENPVIPDSNKTFTDSPFVSVNSVETAIKILPLLSNEVVVERVIINGFAARLQTMDSGDSNLTLTLNALQNQQKIESEVVPERSALSSTQSNDEKIVEDALQKESAASWAIKVLAVEITNGFVSLDDRLNQQQAKIQNLNMSVSAFEFEQWVQSDVSFDGAFNEHNFRVNLQTEFKLDQAGNVALKDLALTGDYKSDLAVLSAYSVQMDTFALDSWSPVHVTVKGSFEQQSFETSLKTTLFIDQASGAFSLKATNLNASLQSDTLNLKDLSVELNGFNIDEWTQIDYTLVANALNNEINSQGTLALRIPETYIPELKNLSTSSSVQGENTDIKVLDLSLSTMKPNQNNKLELALLGELEGNSTDLNASANLMFNEDYSVIKFNKLTVDAKSSGVSVPFSELNLALLSSIKFEADSQLLSVNLDSLKANDVELKGRSTINLTNEIPQIRFDMSSPAIDIDALLAEMENKSDQEPQEKNEKSTGDSLATTQETLQTAAQEPDLAGLSSLNIEGKIKIGKLKVNNAKLSNVRTDISVKNGEAKLKSFLANLYKGSISAKANLNTIDSIPSYKIWADLNKVKVLPLLKDVADSDMVEGTGTVKAEFTGQSLIPEKMMQNIAGVADVIFTDGAVNGINIAHVIRTNYAKLKGEKVPKDEVKKTDFTALTATFNVSHGIVKTNNLRAQSPLLRVDGAGNANYIKQTIDFLTKVSVVGTLEGQGGKGIDDLKDLTIPLRTKGSWEDPKFSLDFSALKEQELKRNKEKLEKKAKAEAERGLKKLLGDKASDDEVEKLKNKLFDKLF